MCNEGETWTVGKGDSQDTKVRGATGVIQKVRSFGVAPVGNKEKSFKFTAVKLIASARGESCCAIGER
jgi:hypothetical protein